MFLVWFFPRRPTKWYGRKSTANRQCTIVLGLLKRKFQTLVAKPRNLKSPFKYFICGRKFTLSTQNYSD